jgi:hypothetical protein
MIAAVLPRPLTKADRRRKTDQFIAVFELNYSSILCFLPFNDHPTVKLSISVIIYSVGESITLVLRVTYG